MDEFPVYNPYSGIQLQSIPFSSEQEADKIIQQAKHARKKMADLSAFEKHAVLSEIVDELNQKKNEFTEIISQESGKPLMYAKSEVERAMATFRIAAEECKRIPHELLDLDASEKGKSLQGVYRYFPAGIVFGISPFNFPLNLAVHKIAPAIAAGCPIILKPSSKTPLTMELLKGVIDKTELPENGFQLIHCSRKVGDYMLEHPDIHVLSFTGSPEVGWEIKSKAGKKKVILELGGNAAAIICADANVNEAINQLTVGGFAYSGQVCIHTQRIYISEKIIDEFCKGFIEKVKLLTIGDPIDSKTAFSVMIDESNAKRVEKWVNEAVASGAKMLLGGKRVGAYYPPTILTNVSKGQKVLEEEVFGPVVIIESFSDVDEAIDKVNDTKWGLQASIFTNDITLKNKAFQELEVGGVIHNLATTFRVDEMPYGGIKDSGFGREGVKYAMMDYLEGKLLVERR